MVLKEGSFTMGERGLARETFLKGVYNSNQSTLSGICNAVAEFIFPDGVLGIDLRLPSLNEVIHFYKALTFSNKKSKREKDVNLASSPKVIATGALSPIRKAKHPVFPGQNLLILVSILLLLTVASTCEAAAQHKETKQILSRKCWNMLEDKCPDTKTNASDFQKECCNSSRILKFHCQFDDDLLFPACVPEETCKPGFSCRIIKGSDGFPQIIQEPCENGLFASENRSSVTQMYPYCTDSHTQCTNVGQKVFCRGDRTTDTRCMCRDGYSTQDHRGCDKTKAFTQHSVCSCIPSDVNITYCPAWKHSETPLCWQLSADQFLINKTNCPEPTEQATNVKGNTTKFHITAPPTDFIKNSTEDRTPKHLLITNPNCLDKSWVIPVITILALLVLACFIAGSIICWARIKALLGEIKDYIFAHADYSVPKDDCELDLPGA